MLLPENQYTKVDLSVEPLFFRIYLEKDKSKLEELLKQKPHIKIYDQISTQLDDLMKSKFPKKKPEPDEMEALKAAHVGNLSMQEYGVWVYYPWVERLLHLLDEEEFVEMRTNRNIYKITREERDVLGRQKIGVVGLSVGQSISVTMAMERSFGEIRLADFDLLELTNLNRIRTGLHNLGLPKVVIVAREIKEIDPFLKVTLFKDGMTEENMDRFFCEGGKLDIIVDECDGLDIKILLRHKAKSLGVPVVMDASDRGTLDVERFDLEPDRPILHGLIDHLDHTKVKYMKTNEDKVPYMLPMVGLHTMSERLKASMVEVGQSISTWPQLASAVTLGGALGADVCRRIALDQYHDSGRYFVDLEELVGDKNPSPDERYVVKDYCAKPLLPEEMRDTTTPLVNKSFILNKQQIEQLVSAAILAPSAGNNQPWMWYANQGNLFLFHNQTVSVSWSDFDEITSNISFGAAIENLKIEAGKLGLQVASSFFPVKENKRLAAAFTFSTSEIAYGKELAPGIALRLTNRKKGNGQKLSREIIASLKSVAELSDGAVLEIVENDEDVQKIADIVAKVERMRFLYPQGHHEFYNSELRWTDEEALETKTGLDIRSLELSESEKAGLFVAKSPGVIKLLNEWGGGAAFEKLSKTAVLSSAGIGLITMPEYSAENFIKGGEAVQRVWLTANLNGLSIHPVSAPIFFLARLNEGNGAEMTTDMIKELEELEATLNKIFSSLEKKQGIFMFRLSYADDASVRSFRKPVEEILQFN
ncbi:Rv1355c family protein [Pedobacter psychroterrae]|uniref:Rv1355c family protein n=1 Tax=Pedobacter psychroterrae TaxID=2530453 RepID=A0A4R0NK19_9SPHI|nr:Rv1355c family protein [Pedobacter psychroterrae]TCD01051.1 Rv1355c family protein [Pedobacter psychroterrae]